MLVKRMSILNSDDWTVFYIQTGRSFFWLGRSAESVNDANFQLVSLLQLSLSLSVSEWPHLERTLKEMDERYIQWTLLIIASKKISQSEGYFANKTELDAKIIEAITLRPNLGLCKQVCAVCLSNLRPWTTSGQ